MNELSKYLVTLIRVVLFFVAFCLFLSAVLPAQRPVMNGLVLGSVVSCLNVLYMARRIRLVAESAATAGKGRKRAGIGFGVRLLTSVAAIMIALKFPQYFNQVAVIASLVFAQFLLQILGMIFAVKEGKSSDEQGGKRES
ncbi:ATP synthase subunit I [Paenibacillus pinistramenti]|uniref:ATP synthase subunit I n=1 Tax=Paenibacillus pinistramenti TaxID=1768003 RepID=UPI001108C981|nr:ATP synthase subunit I [Paenibacillus pinistramenti]